MEIETSYSVQYSHSIQTTESLWHVSELVSSKCSWPPPNSYAEILTTKGNGIRRRDLWEMFSLWGWGIRHWDRCSYKDSLAFSTKWAHSKKASTMKQEAKSNCYKFGTEYILIKLLSFVCIVGYKILNFNKRRNSPFL